MNKAARKLDDFTVPVKIKLSALWASVMFCYVYGDYFTLYRPGKLQGMLHGMMAPLGPATQPVLVFVSVMMAIPSVMIFVSLVLKPRVNRWVQIACGAAYTLIILLTLPGSWAFYIVLGIIEATLTTLVMWYAWRWPAQRESP